MTGKEIYELGSNVQLRADSDLIHTAPRMSFDDLKWCAEFWYFARTVRMNGKISLSAPRIYVALELPSRRLLANERLNSPSREMLGFSFTAADVEKSAELNDYLDFCEEITASAPNEKILTQANELWRRTLPNVLRDRLEEKFF